MCVGDGMGGVCEWGVSSHMALISNVIRDMQRDKQCCNILLQVGLLVWLIEGIWGGPYGFDIMIGRYIFILIYIKVWINNYIMYIE